MKRQRKGRFSSPGASKDEQIICRGLVSNIVIRPGHTRQRDAEKGGRMTGGETGEIGVTGEICQSSVMQHHLRLRIATLVGHAASLAASSPGSKDGSEASERYRTECDRSSVRPHPSFLQHYSRFPDSAGPCFIAPIIALHTSDDSVTISSQPTPIHPTHRHLRIVDCCHSTSFAQH